MVRYQEPVVPVSRIVGWCLLSLGLGLVLFGVWFAYPQAPMNSHSWVGLGNVVIGALVAIVGAGFMLGSSALSRMKDGPSSRSR